MLAVVSCGVGGLLGYGKRVPFSWRFVERNFHNDNRLSWWLSHLSSPLQ